MAKLKLEALGIRAEAPDDFTYRHHFLELSEFFGRMTGKYPHLSREIDDARRMHEMQGAKMFIFSAEDDNGTHIHTCLEPWVRGMFPYSLCEWGYMETAVLFHKGVESPELLKDALAQSGADIKFDGSPCAMLFDLGGLYAMRRFGIAPDVHERRSDWLRYMSQKESTGYSIHHDCDRCAIFTQSLHAYARAIGVGLGAFFAGGMQDDRGFAPRQRAGPYNTAGQ